MRKRGDGRQSGLQEARVPDTQGSPSSHSPVFFPHIMYHYLQLYHVFLYIGSLNDWVIRSLWTNVKAIEQKHIPRQQHTLKPPSEQERQAERVGPTGSKRSWYFWADMPDVEMKPEEMPGILLSHRLHYSVLQEGPSWEVTIFHTGKYYVLVIESLNKL